jgi:hypothetical protein
MARDITWERYMNNAIVANQADAADNIGAPAGVVNVTLDRMPKEDSGQLAPLAIEMLEKLLLVYMREGNLERVLTYNPFCWSLQLFAASECGEVVNWCHAPVTEARTVDEYWDQLNDTGGWDALIEAGVPVELLPVDDHDDDDSMSGE